MDDLLKKANQFESLAKKAARGRKAKTKRNRKQVEKDLHSAKKRYGKSKTDVDDAKAQIANLQKSLAKAESDMNSARDCMVNSHKALKGMDLSGASEVHGDGDDVSYVIDNKRYDLSFSDDGSFELTPAGKKRADSGAADDKPAEEKSNDIDLVDDSLDFSDSDDINWADDFSSLFKI